MIWLLSLALLVGSARSEYELNSLALSSSGIPDFATPSELVKLCDTSQSDVLIVVSAGDPIAKVKESTAKYNNILFSEPCILLLEAIKEVSEQSGVTVYSLEDEYHTVQPGVMLVETVSSFHEADDLLTLVSNPPDPRIQVTIMYTNCPLGASLKRAAAPREKTSRVHFTDRPTDAFTASQLSALAAVVIGIAATTTL